MNSPCLLYLKATWWAHFALANDCGGRLLCLQNRRDWRHSVRLRHSMVQPGHWCCVFLLFVVTGSGRFWVLPKKWHHTALHSCSCQRGLQRMRLWKRPPWGFWLVWPKFTFSFRFSLRFGGDAASCRRRTPGTKLPEWGRVVLITCGRAYSCSK